MGNINSKWINLVFCIDQSGSMRGSESDIVGGFKKVIDEQKAIKDGKVTVSLYTFDSDVKELYLGKDINDIDKFEYRPFGMTKMNDGIGTAIDNVGNWLYEKDKNGEEMPAKTLVVVMTDGQENSSNEYSLKQIQDKIKEQTEKYSWEFMYQGVDITSTKAADELGFKFKTYGSKNKLTNNYNIISSATTKYRSMANVGSSIDEANSVFCASLDEDSKKNTADFESFLGRKISND